MLRLLELCLAMLMLPFVIGFVHLRTKQNPSPASLVYYRYFVFFNVIFASLIVAGRIFLEAQQVPEIEGNVYDFYAIAVLSIMIASLFTLFSRHQLMLASALSWIVFILLSTVMHVVLMGMQEDGKVGLAWVHVGYNLAVVVVLLVLMLRVRRLFDLEERLPRVQQQLG